MKILTSFQRMFWLLYQFLLILEAVNGGSKREMFDCATIHICDCDLADDYEKCWKLSPTEGKERAIASFSEFFPGEYKIEEGMRPFTAEVCKRNDGGNTMFEVFTHIEREFKKYEKEVSSDPNRSEEAMQIHKSKECAMPIMAKCVEFGNQCS
ncbi:hypothetical protein TNCT_148351 [Trichonephila clavata]|uniref:Uncharacterized protein n=1 Tax=Trichonephila clavata TaxID=2740835 RepID=A0A8X6KEW5_TRICU|nr:hypothetical protein TNCT_148351 [Trichonephila clavata]